MILVGMNGHSTSSAIHNMVNYGNSILPALMPHFHENMVLVLTIKESRLHQMGRTRKTK